MKPAGTGAWKMRSFLLLLHIIIDGARNVSEMNALAKTLNVLYPNKTHVVLLSILMNKDIPAILNQMLGASKIVCVKVNSRAIDADKLAN